MFIYLFIYIYIYVYVYLYMYKYIYMYIYIFIYICPSQHVQWVPSGLPIWASPSGAQLGPTEMFLLACI